MTPIRAYPGACVDMYHVDMYMHHVHCSACFISLFDRTYKIVYGVMKNTVDSHIGFCWKCIHTVLGSNWPWPWACSRKCNESHVSSYAVRVQTYHGRCCTWYTRCHMMTGHMLTFHTLICHMLVPRIELYLIGLFTFVSSDPAQNHCKWVEDLFLVMSVRVSATAVFVFRERKKIRILSCGFYWAPAVFGLICQNICWIRREHQNFCFYL